MNDFQPTIMRISWEYHGKSMEARAGYPILMWETLAANFATTMTGVGIPAKVEMTWGWFMALGLPHS